jgi:exodeoxyribonuclease-1
MCAHMFISHRYCYSVPCMKTFFFYDLETSGLNPRFSRIMQFAGIRTDMNLKQIGEPINVFVKMTDDVLPDPGAVMVTGITPQQTLADGFTEPEFCKMLMNEVFTTDTITVGFNSVRFDDEFIRHTFWRNFYDPYEWAWSEGRSRWDMLDVVRMTRALRPEGIKWPVDETGKAVNKLELIAKENGLLHTKAHDALSDVEALIGIATLIKGKHAKLFKYLLGMRDKKKVAELVNLENPQPFVYSSGRYDAVHEKTTVAFPIAPGAKHGSVLVYDLRYDPTPFLNASPTALASVIFADKKTRESEDYHRLPVKELSYNKCPAVAPIGVLGEESQKRLSIDLPVIQKHIAILASNTAFAGAVREAFEMREPYAPSSDVEAQLYDGFINDKDKGRMAVVRAADVNELADFHPSFADDRLAELLLRYKARSFPASLSEEEMQRWEAFRSEKLKTQMPVYLEQLQKMASYTRDTYLFEELQLWAESVMPADI